METLAYLACMLRLAVEQRGAALVASGKDNAERFYLAQRILTGRASDYEHREHERLRLASYEHLRVLNACEESVERYMAAMRDERNRILGGNDDAE
jgi:hypothetical protein